jgi:BMFP domain-containing protein YqiC
METALDMLQKQTQNGFFQMQTQMHTMQTQMQTQMQGILEWMDVVMEERFKGMATMLAAQIETLRTKESETALKC